MSEKRYELSELLQLMKANKVTNLKMGGMELELHPSAFESPFSPSTDALEAEPMPTPDEMQYGAGLLVMPAEEEV